MGDIQFNMAEMDEELEKRKVQIEKYIDEKINSVLSKNNDILKNQMEIFLNENKKLIDFYGKFEREILWSNIFNNTITGSKWLKDQSFSLGRWAIGYPCAYVLYRVLNELHPKSILELGLGQSTKFTGQYAKTDDKVEHIVIEHDPEWIEFFSRNYVLPDNSKIVNCPWTYGTYKEIKNIREFDNFQQVISGKRFNLIIVDAPWGGDMKDFSRIDVLRTLPDCLADSFVIIFDDCNRSGEQHTFDEMLRVLQENEIDFRHGQYKGEKTTNVICSSDYKFVVSM